MSQAVIVANNSVNLLNTVYQACSNCFVNKAFNPHCILVKLQYYFGFADLSLGDV